MKYTAEATAVFLCQICLVLHHSINVGPMILNSDISRIELVVLAALLLILN